MSEIEYIKSIRSLLIAKRATELAKQVLSSDLPEDIELTGHVFSDGTAERRLTRTAALRAAVKEHVSDSLIIDELLMPSSD